MSFAIGNERYQCLSHLRIPVSFSKPAAWKKSLLVAYFSAFDASQLAAEVSSVTEFLFVDGIFVMNSDKQRPTKTPAP